MQNILTIDTSVHPAIASVVQVSGRDIEVLEQFEQDLKGLFSQRELESIALEVESSEDSSESEESHTQERLLSNSALSELISKFKTPWTASYLIIPPYDSTSLNVSLPFGDPKRIEKIIDLEVQDVLPFDTEEFLIHHLPISHTDQGDFDIHVNLIPKQIVASSLEVCRESDFEPQIISSPGGTAASIYYIAPDYIADNAAIILEQNGWHYVTVAFDGEPHIDRIIRPNPELNGNAELDLVAQIRVTINAAEQKYQKNIEVAYIINSSLKIRTLQETLGRRVETLEIGELVKKGAFKDNLAQLGAFFAQDTTPVAPFANYRTREFAYRPQLKELMRGLKELKPFTLASLALVFICLLSIYLVRDYRIASTENAIAEHVSKVLPGITLPKGKEIAILQGRIGVLHKELQTLGSATKYSPLSIFRTLSEVFPKGQDLEVDHIEIRGDRVVVEGSAPNYKTIERVKKNLLDNISISEVKDETRTARQRRIAFTFTIRLEG